MGKIIVGFDFSKGSAIAVDLAIDIANGWHYDITIVYVKEKHEDEKPIRAEIERRNAGVAHLLKGISLDYVIRQGKVSNELISQAVKEQASLIVVGTRSMAGEKISFIGSNTYRTVAESPIPVHTVREEFNFNKKLENIVLPIDGTPSTRQKVAFTAKYAEAFGSKITVLGLRTAESDGVRRNLENYVNQTANYLAKKNIEHEVKFINDVKNIASSVNEYANSISADLISVMVKNDSPIYDFVIGSATQQLLQTASIPILTMQPTEIGINNRWS